MTGIEAEQLGRRIAIHLRRNDFEGCRNIINNKERQRKELAESPAEQPTALAEIGLDLRWVNMLEEMGCVYIRDLEGLDLRPFLYTIPNIGDKAVEEILDKLQPYFSSTGRIMR